jgi:hypothetical protein
MKAIICGGATGRAVIYGEVDEFPAADTPVKIRNARMILRWDEECGGLLGLSQIGPKGDTRLTRAVDLVSDTARQALTVSSEAAVALDAWPNYR